MKFILSTSHILFATTLLLSACQPSSQKDTLAPNPVGSSIDLPQPFDTEVAVQIPLNIGWQPGQKPTVPEGFEVSAYIKAIDNPLWLHTLDDGSVLVAQSGVQQLELSKKEGLNRILHTRDLDEDGYAEAQRIFTQHTIGVCGMAHSDSVIYYADSYRIYKATFAEGQTALYQKQTLTDLPGGGYHGHWMRNILIDPSGEFLYVTVGSLTNAMIDPLKLEEEQGRAAILKVDLQTGKKEFYAHGMRNPVGMDFEPTTGKLWAVVSERKDLGDNLVPDYLTEVEYGDFFGWPWYYWGNHVDPRHKEIPVVDQDIKKPDYSLGAHIEARDLMFYKGNNFPAEWSHGAFVAENGSWNRSELSGYQVAYVPFENGKPSGDPIPFMTGFLDGSPKENTHGRPSGLALLPDGSVLVADDAGNMVWKVSFTGEQ
ncbi:MAG: glucose/arabinose dehydrogenase [Flavobacteriales bacterium]|jgi:glucose/arabinose dehydrogenase